MTTKPINADIDRVMAYLKKVRSFVEESEKHERCIGNLDEEGVVGGNGQRDK